MNHIGPRRVRDLAFVQLLREVRRAMRFADRESLSWLIMVADEIEAAVCVRCLTLEDVLDAIMSAQAKGSVLDPLPEYTPAAASPPPRRRWLPW